MLGNNVKTNPDRNNKQSNFTQSEKVQSFSSYGATVSQTIQANHLWFQILTPLWLISLVFAAFAINRANANLASLSILILIILGGLTCGANIGSLSRYQYEKNKSHIISSAILFVSNLPLIVYLFLSNRNVVVDSTERMIVFGVLSLCLGVFGYSLPYELQKKRFWREALINRHLSPQDRRRIGTRELINSAELPVVSYATYYDAQNMSVTHEILRLAIPLLGLILVSIVQLFIV